MSGIFFSYRRADSGEKVERMYDWFRRTLPLQEIFYDLVSMQSGEDFPERIVDFISHASVVLVIIGPSWIDVRNEKGRDGLILNRTGYGEK